jgi:hypothetical protein
MAATNIPPQRSINENTQISAESLGDLYGQKGIYPAERKLYTARSGLSSLNWISGRTAELKRA